MSRLDQYDLIEYAKGNDLEGTGSNINPFIFKTDFLVVFDEPLVFVDSDLFIKFIGIEFHQQDEWLLFKNCKNMIFDNCTFNRVKFKRCSNITLNNSKITFLYLSKCNSSLFENNTAGHLLIYRSFGNQFKTCHFNSAVNAHSRGNVFEKVQINDFDYEKFVKGLGGKWLIFANFAILIVIIIELPTLFNSWFIPNFLFLNLLVISVLLLTLLYIDLLFLWNRSKAKKFLPNLII